jgi:hypothetical protein
MANNAYHKIPQESRELLESAIRLLKSPLASLAHDDVVLMAYNLGRMDGRMEQLDRCDAVIRATFDVPGRPDHDLDTTGAPLKPGS